MVECCRSPTVRHLSLKQGIVGSTPTGSTRRLSMKYAILALFFLASYAMAAAPPTNPLTITYKEAGKTFFVETGDTVVVDLFSQPGEGQFWCLKKVEGKAIKLDRFILEALDKEEGDKVGGR